MITLTVNKFALVKEGKKWYCYNAGIVNYVDNNIPKEVHQFDTEQELVDYINANDITVETNVD